MQDHDLRVLHSYDERRIALRLFAVERMGVSADFLKRSEIKGAFERRSHREISSEEIPSEYLPPEISEALYLKSFQILAENWMLVLNVLINIKEDTKVTPDFKNGIGTLNTNSILQYRQKNTICVLDEHICVWTSTTCTLRKSF